MLKFYKCAHCGNVIVKVVDQGVPVMCCGEPMGEMSANTEDAAVEKHVPEVNVDGDTLTAKVGSVEHPMEEAHFIQFVAVELEDGYQIKTLSPGDTPEAKFVIGDKKPVAVYELCNLHGLWKKEL